LIIKLPKNQERETKYKINQLPVYTTGMRNQLPAFIADFDAARTGQHSSGDSRSC